MLPNKVLVFSFSYPADCWELRSIRFYSDTTSSLGVFLLFFCCCSVIMPMRKSFRVSRELKHLTTTGGKGGRLHRDFFSDWKFECLPVACGNSVVTPAVGNELHSNVIGSRGSTPVQEHDVIDEEEDELLSSSSDDTSNYSSEYVDDDYSDSDDDVDACSIPTVPDEPDVAQRKKPVNGNRVVSPENSHV